MHDSSYIGISKLDKLIEIVETNDSFPGAGEKGK